MSDIFVTKAFLPPKEEYFEIISSIWDNHMLTNMGPIHNRFEEALKNRLKVPYGLLLNNGHSSLELTLKALELKGEVITTPFTFVSTTHAIVRNNLKPVFCDINPDDYTIDVTKIESLITSRTCAIVPVHVYGHVCNVNRIEEIARKYNLKVIYDGAHGFGEVYKNKSIGSYGDATIFSFHATKPFNSIEGGLVTLASESLEKKLKSMRNYGITGEDSIAYMGSNCKMSEFHAAMGLCNLKYIDEITQKRKNIYELYLKELSNIEGITINRIQENLTSNYAYCPILINQDLYGRSREELYSYLSSYGIHGRKYFYPLTSNYECYKSILECNTPIAERVSREVLTIPLYDSLDLEDAYRICKLIKDFKR